MNENQITVLQTPNESQPIRPTVFGCRGTRGKDASDPECAFDFASAELRHFSWNSFAADDWPARFDQAAR